jgi:serine/threonine-protein kinase
MSEQPRSEPTVDLAPAASVLRALGLPQVVLPEPTPEAAEPVVRPQSDTLPGRQDPAARLQLHGEIGRGGMGAVLKGRDADLGRDVAVKVLLEAHAGKAELLQRFVEEAQIAGQLQHPAVVPVYELGAFPDRRPYFTMKLVKGQTLARLLVERADPIQDWPRLLKVFEQVCQALAYAHARRVIHRDLKPSNVMVGAFGEVQVMDWGLAKVLPQGGVADEAQAAGEVSVIRTARSGSDTPAGPGTQTQAGQVLGTPAYMAPEQARGQVARLDERCDVFGLGAILCHILTGRPPFAGAAEEAMRRARAADLADTFGRLDDCGADVELVALAKRCLAADPGERPRDAGALAAALTAYLESVEARLRRTELGRAAAEARAAEERRRRRAQLGLAAAVLLALAGAAAAGLWYQRDRAARAAKAARRAADGERDVTAALQEVAALRNQARALTDDPVRWEATLVAARAAARRAEGVLNSSEAGDTPRQRVRAALADLDAAEKDRRVMAALDEARLTRTRLGQDGVRDDKESMAPLFEAAFRAYGIDVRALPPTRAAEFVAASPVLDALVAALENWAQFAPAEADRRRIREVVRLADPDPKSFRNRLAAAVRDGRPALRRLVAEGDVRALPPAALVNLGGALAQAGAADEAETLLRRAQQRYPADFWVNHELAFLLSRRGKAHLADAVTYYRVALALRPRSPTVRLNLGGALRERGRAKEAEAVYREALRLWQRYAKIHSNLSLALADQARLPEAEAAARRAVQVDPGYFRGHFNLGNALLKQRKWKEAERAFREAARLEPGDSRAHNNLGLALNEQGRHAEAEAECRKALERDADNAKAHYNRAIALAALHRPAEAEAEYGKAIRIQDDFADAHVNLGILLAGQRRGAEAEGHLRRAVAAAPGSAGARYNLGLVLMEQDSFAGAEPELRAAAKIEPGKADAHYYLGVALQRQGKYADALEPLQAAIRVRSDNPRYHATLSLVLLRLRRYADAERACLAGIRWDDPRSPAGHYDLGLILYRQGKWKEAEKAYRDTIRLDPAHAQAYCELGYVLKMQGRFQESLVCYVRGDRLGTDRPGWTYDSARGVQEARELVALDRRLAGVEKGAPADAAERLALAQLCSFYKRRYATAVRLYAGAFAAAPPLAADLRQQHRYAAARSAARAAAGQGEDARDLPDRVVLALRRQALRWLREDLVLYAQSARLDDPRAKEAVRQRLEHWGRDADLAGVRDQGALDRLPGAERRAWGRLWEDVAAVLKTVQAKR